MSQLSQLDHRAGIRFEPRPDLDQGPPNADILGHCMKANKVRGVPLNYFRYLERRQDEILW
jgi:hypothetical protein